MLSVSITRQGIKLSKHSYNLLLMFPGGASIVQDVAFILSAALGQDDELWGDIVCFHGD